MAMALAPAENSNPPDANFEEAPALVETRGESPGRRADLPPGSEQRILAYFGCSKQPFADLDDPDLTYLSPLYLEAVKALIDAVESNLGFSALIAEAGMGKTTLLCRLLECYSTAAHTAFLSHTCGNASGLKQALLNELQTMMMHGSGGDRRVLHLVAVRRAKAVSPLRFATAVQKSYRCRRVPRNSSPT
jgi:type II secretory pathway predicted ATPase ExeA